MPNELANFPITEIKGRLGHDLPVSWAFIEVYQDVRFGQIEGLKIQGGLPMRAEPVTNKIRYSEDKA
jgi:hypothetical protein